MKTMTQDITLQINLSPGDANYALLTVPALVSRHSNIEERLLVVDLCRPQKTKLVDPDRKFPLAVFNQNVKRIIAISEQLLKAKVVTAIYYLKPGDNLFKKLAKKYLNDIYDCTHGAGGTANMAYWAGIELPATRFVLHYDGDMLLYQKPGSYWPQQAIAYLEKNEDSLFAIPRPSPPVEASGSDQPTLHEGRPLESFSDYWKNDWFSTRHFLVDREKLQKFLPLVRGNLMLELLARKYTRSAFPLDPEIILFRSLAPRGVKRIILKDYDAWMIHPVTKPKEYLAILSRIIATVSAGEVPPGQRGYENIDLHAWTKYFEKQSR